jgi:UDP-N-acetylmuramyl pentapeptide phosphotransferase/UDP-N-acetylglucosamine-1-phosphate transferase
MLSHAVVIALTAFLVSASAVAWLARGRAAQLGLDEPNARSLHQVAVPRTGGLGLLLGIASAWLMIAPRLHWAWWLALALIIAVSLADDLRGLHAAMRFGAHLLASALAAYTFLPTNSTAWVIAALIIGIGWMCNLYNFMDGSDGLAGGMALFGFLAYAAAAWLTGNTEFALLNISIAAAAAGFLMHNFHPARIFLGDAGSVSLGFLAAIFGLMGWLQGNWDWWFPLLVFSPFIVDASATLLRRMFAGARVWEAHRDHYYQRLVQLGFGHRDTALAEYALMSLCAFAGLWAMTLERKGQYLVLIATGLLYVVTIVGIERLWRKRLKTHA